jgi:8-hydroxy-5-deazaflavin:NADPH oxidoreductase
MAAPHGVAHDAARNEDVAVQIGIIGSGNMGRTLGLAWARSGHEVCFGSRDPSKARALAGQGGASARAGDFDAAAAFGEVVLYTVRDVLPSRLLADVTVLADKVVVDCNNRDIGDDSDPSSFRFDMPPEAISSTQRLARDIPDARVVKAFNTLPSPVLALDREQLARARVSLFACADDGVAKAKVLGLAEQLGLHGIDCGGLERSWLLDALADFVRLQVGVLGLGPYACLSLQVLSTAEAVQR